MKPFVTFIFAFLAVAGLVSAQAPSPDATTSVTIGGKVLSINTPHRRSGSGRFLAPAVLSVTIRTTRCGGGREFRNFVSYRRGFDDRDAAGAEGRLYDLRAGSRPE